MVWYEPMNPNQTTTSTMEQREMRRVPQKGSTIEALTHKKWTNNSIGCKQHQRQPSIELSQDSR